jgi:hypothetical protein
MPSGRLVPARQDGGAGAVARLAEPGRSPNIISVTSNPARTIRRAAGCSVENQTPTAAFAGWRCGAGRGRRGCTPGRGRSPECRWLPRSASMLRRQVSEEPHVRPPDGLQFVNQIAERQTVEAGDARTRSRRSRAAALCRHGRNAARGSRRRAAIDQVTDDLLDASGVGAWRTLPCSSGTVRSRASMSASCVWRVERISSSGTRATQLP